MELKRSTIHCGAEGAIGRSEDGSWRTTMLKEYPESMCRAIALAIKDSIAECLSSNRTFCDGSVEADHEAYLELQTRIQNMIQRWDPYMVDLYNNKIDQDYHGFKRI